MTHIVTTREGAVQRIQLNRPEKKNALTTAMYAALADAIAAAAADPAVRVMLLHGAGDCFTAGNDLQDFLAAPPQWRPPAATRGQGHGGAAGKRARQLQRLVRRMFYTPLASTMSKTPRRSLRSCSRSMAMDGL